MYGEWVRMGGVTWLVVVGDDHERRATSFDWLVQVKPSRKKYQSGWHRCRGREYGQDYLPLGSGVVSTAFKAAPVGS